MLGCTCVCVSVCIISVGASVHGENNTIQTRKIRIHLYYVCAVCQDVPVCVFVCVCDSGTGGREVV